MRSQRGFTLIGIVLLLFLLVIALGAVALFQLQVVTAERESVTKDKMDRLKMAVVGNPTIITTDVRVSFGYLGSMGGVPANLQDLWIKGSQPSYTYDTTLKIGAGWIGPYLDIGTSIDNFKFDEWGTAFENISQEYSRADGAIVSARIRSAGPDKVFDTGDDRYIEILKNEAFATVTGYVFNKGGGAAKYIQVTLNLPQNGGLSKRYAATDVNGFYTFQNVPFGVRTATVDPKLIYAAGSAILQGSSNEDLYFTISNFGANDVTITSLRAVYSKVAYYERVKVGGLTAFSSTSLRNGSGDLIDFSSQPQTIKGTGKIIPPTVFLAQLPNVKVDDVVVGSTGSGSSLNISLGNFTSVRTGSGSLVDMTGVTFTVTFSDGSEVTFTTPTT